MNIHVRTLHWCYISDTKLRVSEWKSEIQDDGCKNSVAHISARIYDSNEIQTATPMFPGQAKRIEIPIEQHHNVLLRVLWL